MSLEYKEVYTEEQQRKLEDLISIYAGNCITSSDKEFFNKTHTVFHKAEMTENLEKWFKNKKHIYELFGNKLKVEIPLDENEVLLSDAMIAGMFEKETLPEIAKVNCVISNFLSQLSIKEYSINHIKTHLMVCGEVFLPETKISKIFKVFEKDPKKLEKIQNIYSKFLQGLKVKGTLVLSIDPIDYVTMSVSSSNWVSCHHPNHLYGAGGLAYLVDNSTIISYVTSSQNVIKYKNNYFTSTDRDNELSIEINNKLWRQIVHISSNHRYAIQMRQYPSTNITFRKMASRKLIELLEADKKVDYNYTIIDPCDWEDYNLIHYNDRLNASYHYNDFIEQSFRSAILVLPKSYNKDVSSFIDDIVVSIGTGDTFKCPCGCGLDSGDVDAVTDDVSFFICESVWEDEEEDEDEEYI